MKNSVFFCDIEGTFGGISSFSINTREDINTFFCTLNDYAENFGFDCVYFTFISSAETDELKNIVDYCLPFVNKYKHVKMLDTKTSDSVVVFNEQNNEQTCEINSELNDKPQHKIITKIDQIFWAIKGPLNGGNDIFSVFSAEDSELNQIIIELNLKNKFRRNNSKDKVDLIFFDTETDKKSKGNHICSNRHGSAVLAQMVEEWASTSQK